MKNLKNLKANKKIKVLSTKKQNKVLGGVAYVMIDDIAAGSATAKDIIMIDDILG